MIPEEMLRQVAEEAEQARMAQLPEAEACEHTFSEEFVSRMEALCRRQKRTKTYTFCLRAACAVLAVLLLGSVVMMHTEVRAAVNIWIRAVFSNVDTFSPIDNVAGETEKIYMFGEIPEGFVLDKENKEFCSSVYKDEKGRALHFVYMQGADAGELNVFTDEYAHCTVSVNGKQADAYIAQKENLNNSIIWSNSEGVLFWLSGPLDLQILIRAGESVCSVEK